MQESETNGPLRHTIRPLYERFNHLMSSSIVRRGLVSLAAVALTAGAAFSGVGSATAKPEVAPAPQVAQVAQAPQVAGQPSDPTTVGGEGDFNMFAKSETGLSYTTAWTATSAWNTVKYNRAYKTGRIYPSKCGQPKYALNGSNNILAWHRSYGYCLNKSWVGKIQAAGYKFVPPTWVIYTKPMNTRCGYANGSRAFYCPATNGIYIPVNPIVSLYKSNPRLNLVRVMQTAGHEYGHHVQKLTNILSASWYRQQYVIPTTAKDLEENRRVELQATCWSAAYIGSNRGYLGMTGARLADWRWHIAHIGDEYNNGGPRTHGSRSSNNWWATNGFNYMNVGSCATWNGASSIVD